MTQETIEAMTDRLEIIRLSERLLTRAHELTIDEADRATFDRLPQARILSADVNILEGVLILLKAIG